MSVLADNRSAIIALAEALDPADRTLRRLEAYVALQHFVCGWALFPGTDAESSPFNECRHGELAGVRAILSRLRSTAQGDARVEDLVRKVEAQMLDRHAAMQLCRYSEEPFNTADVVFPNWGNAWSDPASLGVGSSIALLAAGGAVAGRRRKRLPRVIAREAAS